MKFLAGQDQKEDLFHQRALTTLANSFVRPGGESQVQGPWYELLEHPYSQSTDSARGGNECWELESRQLAAAKAFTVVWFTGILVC